MKHFSMSHGVGVSGDTPSIRQPLTYLQKIDNWIMAVQLYGVRAGRRGIGLYLPAL